MPEAKRIEVKVNLTEIASTPQARVWAASPSFLDKCTDADHRWFFDGGDAGSCFLVLHYLPFQAPKIRAAAWRVARFAQRSMASSVVGLTVEESIRLALNYELHSSTEPTIHG